jgi:hypothetical protein
MFRHHLLHPIQPSNICVRRSTVSRANSQHYAPSTLPLSPATLHRPAPTKQWNLVSRIQHPHANTAPLRTLQAVVLALLRSPRVTPTSNTLNPPLLTQESRKPPSIVPPLSQVPLQPTLLLSVATLPFAALQATPHQP